MVSKEDAIELEKIMKRRFNSPADCLKEVHLQPIIEHEAISSKTVKELRTADVPEALGQIASETSINEVDKAPIKHSYVNPFQNGTKRFTPSSAKCLENDETNCLSEELNLKSSQIIPSFEIRQRTEKQGCSSLLFMCFFWLFSYSFNFYAI